MYLQVLAYIIPAKILRTRILVIATHRFENTRASRAEIICAEIPIITAGGREIAIKLMRAFTGVKITTICGAGLAVIAYRGVTGNAFTC